MIAKQKSAQAKEASKAAKGMNFYFVSIWFLLQGPSFSFHCIFPPRYLSKSSYCATEWDLHELFGASLLKIASAYIIQNFSYFLTFINVLSTQKLQVTISTEQ
jgi:hypothetical protein